MFTQIKKINNESGVILFIVLMVSIIIMIYSLSLLTQSMNEINYAQQQIDQIASEELAKGMFWNSYSNSFASNIGISTVIQGRTYNETVSFAANGQATVMSNYDSFQ